MLAFSHSSDARFGWWDDRETAIQKSKALLTRALELDAENADAHMVQGMLFTFEGRFDECKAMFAKDLPPAQVEANMSYVRALLTQQNRWDLIKGAKANG